MHNTNYDDSPLFAVYLSCCKSLLSLLMSHLNQKVIMLYGSPIPIAKVCTSEINF